MRQPIKSEGPVVVVEGVTDAWRLGPGAVALFGKSIATEQSQLILRYCLGRPIVVLLDADAEDNARRVCQKIRNSRIAAGDKSPVVIGKLPAGRKDPGECTSKEAWKAVEKAMTATNHGVRLA